MAETKIEKNTSLGAGSKEAGAEAAGAADAVPVVIPSAGAERELSDDDLERVSGGAADTSTPPRRPTSRAL